MPNLTLNEARIKALTRHKAAYDIPDGKLRGCGVRVLHSGKKRFFVHCQRDRFADDIDEATAEQLLRRDAEVAERAVLPLIRVPLQDRQFDAPVSFAFNLGAGALQRSTLRRRVNREEHGAVPREFRC